MKYKVWSDRIKLIDSCNVSKYDMFAELESVRLKTLGSEVWKRSMRSLYFEWVAHNALYALNFRRSRTKDVDLEHTPKWYISVLYGIFGRLAWPFID